MFNDKISKEELERISGVKVNKCMKCGKCSATCPNFDAMDYHPHQFVDKGNIAPLLASDSIWTCLSCMACLQRCPRSVEPAKLIEAVRLAVVRQQDQNYLKAEEIPELLDENLPQQAIVSAFRKFKK